MMTSPRTPPRLTKDLSTTRCRAYEELATSLVKRTVTQYGNHVRRTEASHDRVDAKSWKLLKTRENIRIYKSRDTFQPDVFAESSTSTNHFNNNSPQPHRWTPHIRLLCVGTLAGTLEDAMLGTVTPTEVTMASRSLSIHDEFIKHTVLRDIKVPTRDEPFAYVGLKWALRRSRLRSIVRARDLVYLEASGFQVAPLHDTHERIGYTLCHSVELPELDLPATKDVVRAKFSMCSIYRQKAPGVVDVFVTLTSDPGGSLPPKVAALSATGALIAAAKVMDSALDRKLAWLLRSQYTAAVSPDGACIAVAKAQGSHWCCLRCTRTLSSFASLQTCGVCHLTVCARCLAPRKLAVGATPDEFTRKSYQVCTGCTASAMRGLDTMQVAADEFARGDETPITPQTPEVKAVDHVPSSPTDTNSFTSRRNSRSPAPYQPDRILLYAESNDSDASEFNQFHSTTSAGTSADFYPTTRPLHLDQYTKSLHLDDLAILDGEYGADVLVDDEDEEILVAASMSPKALERLRLLEQMNELRAQAEQTFRMTKRQTRTLQRSKLAEVDMRFARRAMSKSAIY